MVEMVLMLMWCWVVAVVRDVFDGCGCNALAQWLQSYMKQQRMSDVVTKCKTTLSWVWCCVSWPAAIYVDTTCPF